MKLKMGRIFRSDGKLCISTGLCMATKCSECSAIAAVSPYPKRWRPLANYYEENAKLPATKEPRRSIRNHSEAEQRHQTSLRMLVPAPCQGGHLPRLPVPGKDVCEGRSQNVGLISSLVFSHSNIKQGPMTTFKRAKTKVDYGSDPLN